MSHVFNFDVPTHAEDYVHRIGRTGRAGRKGAAFTLATRNDAKYVEAIEQLTDQQIPRGTFGEAEEDANTEDKPKNRNRRNRGGRGRNRGGDKSDAPQNTEGKSEAKPGGQRRGLLGRNRRGNKPQNNDAPKAEAKPDKPRTGKKSSDAFEGNMPDFLK